MITQEFLKGSGFAQELYADAARLAAAEAVECLWSIYWAHSFDGQLLTEQIAAVILPVVSGAIPLTIDAYDEVAEQPKTPVRVYPRPAAGDRVAGTDAMAEIDALLNIRVS